MEVRPELWGRICPREHVGETLRTQKTAKVRRLPWNRSACERVTRRWGWEWGAG